MGITDFIKDLLGINFKRTIENVGHEILHALYSSLRDIERRIMKGITAVLFIMIGIVFLSIAMVFFLIEQLGLSNTLSFFVIAIIFLLIGIIVKIMR
jgi:hypothetical protein